MKNINSTYIFIILILLSGNIYSQKTQTLTSEEQRYEDGYQRNRYLLDSLFNTLTTPETPYYPIHEEKELHVENKLYENNIVLITYNLRNRTIITKPIPHFDFIDDTDIGTVVVRVVVSQKGEVIYANPGAKGSTTLNLALLFKCKETAMKTVWQNDSLAPEKQEGEIIYQYIYDY